MAATWATCSVMAAGPAENGEIYIFLKDQAGAFNNWYRAVPAMRKEMLATALTVVSTGKSASVHLSDTKAESVINRFYVTT